jgi:photosystem I subunit 3|mmetsp:Transcript_1680/g.3058  ORF Transcript_1680/g.3058 Transcript_1680/m.3058 type:complete len:322 (+) Transcript_1680:46-1011(+)|eukprot:CAMPEP_0174281578 /NCGR_PEP_ID=MMETSP0809-20121228/1948_1 /TAXON_ID=73025 ORGANISM="Eutreptiella gymnastica-like, Strain CCMP1594" /NCGR_SAMPLE_ID=MMETSP0809 /ASSEMBLY_ACC=CAM_ASM_000658 /LENGTH=321 /DNA_ID=CAMNT_0015375207 /DNA_START=37 /DNA_END=1002 /DNA_ORIENTATION=+
MSSQNKQWSLASVVGAAALISVSVGVTIGLVASHSTTTDLYAPVATTSRPMVGTAAAIPHHAMAAPREAVTVEAAPASAEAAEYDMTMEDTHATFNWAPVAALIALPAALAAFLLRRPQSQETELPLVNKMKVAGAGLAASAVLASSTPMPAMAAENISGLTPCAESKKFQKTLKKEIKTLEKREKLYEPGSAPYLALESTKARTVKRFDSYAKAGLLCGADGLPHLISDPGLAVRYGHAGETFIPTFGFLYIAGYIGTAGRTYLQEIKGRKKPTESEIIIDVPLATSIAAKSWNWPATAFTELTNGDLLEKDENVTRSPR